MSAVGPIVYVVHCVDTEGPLGGDARRLPNGDPEFFDDWAAIEESLAELTAAETRTALADSFGRPYLYNWFILDFTGFRTNPKERVAAYHDTYDHLRALPTEPDGMYWHYHAPPASGIGDQWAESWLESNEHNAILARRLLERGTFPEAYRAGGTIEDDVANRWLEEVFLLDFSNRSSDRSRPGTDLFSFDWYGAAASWLPYHPSPQSFLAPGRLRRFVYRSLDLRSRYNLVDAPVVEAAFLEARDRGAPLVLSYFSHDNRDMRPETYDVVRDVRAASESTGVPWATCTGVEAHCRLHGLAPEPVELALTLDGVRAVVSTDREPFQRTPFVAAELADGRFVRLAARPVGARRWDVPLPAPVRRLAAAVTSSSGTVSVAAADA